MKLNTVHSSYSRSNDRLRERSAKAPGDKDAEGPISVTMNRVRDCQAERCCQDTKAVRDRTNNRERQRVRSITISKFKPKREHNPRHILKTSQTQTVSKVESKTCVPGDDLNMVHHSTTSSPTGCPYVPAPTIVSKAQKEFDAISAHYPLLSDSSCTTQFCQSGRMVHTREPRIGQERSVEHQLAEAKDFLMQLRRDQVIPSDDILAGRVHEISQQIMTRRTWVQTELELRHGIRLAWKHSKRCIMRSEWQNLRLCHLGHIKNSQEMGTVLMEEARKAFNNGDVKPAAFVFPPCSPGKPGPRIWNHQLLGFAGYQMEDGTILGDPSNADVTRSIMELGWKPPEVRTKWDLLPLVTQAEDDDPFVTPIDEDDFPLVYIRHPKCLLQFEKLGLRWVPTPALCRLGFDIGGVQYTAAPFMGWFMDAEIGLRDLVDESRYNVLPQVVKALDLLEPGRSLASIPEYERLALLSRAQTELNYAVYWSFSKAGVRMSDSLTASNMYMNFDKEHFREKGFRLPADPYWLAPPTGSLIPIWHHGGAPNYQPKPLIARHVEDPIRSWRRSREQPADVDVTISNLSLSDTGPRRRTIHVHYVSSGTTAAKLAGRARDHLKDMSSSDTSVQFPPISSLNELDPERIASTDVVIVVVSSCGRGQVPANGQSFLWRLKELQHSSKVAFQFAIFGNGDSTYADSYNGASREIEAALSQSSARHLLPAFDGDVEAEDQLWTQLDMWLQMLRVLLFGSRDEAFALTNDTLDKVSVQSARQKTLTTLSADTIVAKVVTCTSTPGGIKNVVLDIGDVQYPDLSYVDVFVPNDSMHVLQVLASLRFAVGSCGLPSDISPKQFLTHFANLDRPFLDICWADRLNLPAVARRSLAEDSISTAIKSLPFGWPTKVDLSEVIAAMPLQTPRRYSAASAHSYALAHDALGTLSLLVQTHAGGLFGEKYLSGDVGSLAPLKIRFKTTTIQDQLRQLVVPGPLIVFTTGSGIAPLRSYLQGRIQGTATDVQPAEAQRNAPVSIFCAFKSRDASLITDTLDTATELGIVDMLFMKPSSGGSTSGSESIRYVQDHMFEDTVRPHIVSKLRQPNARVFVCANGVAAKDFEENLSAILGRDIKSALRERYVEEFFNAAL